MPTATTHHTSSSSPAGLAAGIRRSLARLDSLDRDTADYLKTLAFVMYRVAAADEHVSDDEVRRMEAILVDHASLSLPEAVLTVEIARHCRKTADCARSYDASRQLRARSTTMTGAGCAHSSPRWPRPTDGYGRPRKTQSGRFRPNSVFPAEDLSSNLGSAIIPCAARVRAGGGVDDLELLEKTTELFMAAVQGKPGTHLGEIEDADGFGEHGSIACGDALRFTFRVDRHPADPKQDRITEARYLTFGCTSAIAASEALCAIIEEGDFTPIDALKITNSDIVNYLEGLPQAKIHCSVMGAEALEAAVFNWAQKRGVDLVDLGIDIRREEQEEGRLVCTCFGLTEPYIERKIKELDLKTIGDITGAIKAGGACMSCHHTPGGLQDILNKVWGERPTAFKELPVLPMAREPKAQPPREMSPFKFAKLVDNVLDKYARPQLARDGGDIEIVDIKDRVVYVELKGACSNCMGSTNTVKMLVEQALKDHVDEQIRVIEV